MSEQFYNPYQFVPVDTRKAKETVAYPKQKDGLKTNDNHFARHDYWRKDGFSGRICCSLKILTPTVIGAMQHQGEPPDEKKNKLGKPGTVDPYLDVNGKPAIPGSSLRGMIGSIAETLSQSTLRVLISEGHGEYSVRKPAKASEAEDHEKPMKHMGILLKRENGYEIYPLVDDDKFKAYSIGDYLDKRDDEDKERREWREKEIKLLKTENCFQYHHNQKFDSWRSHPKGVYYIRGKIKGMPSKRRENFIPWDGEFNRGFVPVAEGCVKTFETILRTLYSTYKKEEKKNHQLLPKGYNNEKRQQCWESADKPVVWDGDLVYYREDNGVIVEISYSSIWRRAVPGDIHEAFTNTAGENSIPWNSKREELTPAEALFGVVEDKPDTEKRGGARNLASRVRFSDATTTSKIGLEEQSVTLKILNSPKPPSPAMYFCDAGKEHIEKTRLDMHKNGNGTPNGRKHYLPHKAALPEYTDGKPEKPWESRQPEDRPHMRLKCWPIPAGDEVKFSFDIHFENLSQQELGLLLTALQPNGKEKPFIHRIGLGKPIGLGHVEITDACCELISRQQRYSISGLKTGRYQPWKDEVDTTLVDQDALAELTSLADPARLEDWPVCYPFDQIKEPKQQPHNEDKSYRWFTENERVNQFGRHDFLHREKSGNPMRPLFSGYKPLKS